MANNDRDLLLRAIPENAVVSNARLVKELGWTAERLRKVREPLVKEGVLLVGRGRGGTLRRAQDDQAAILRAVTENGGSMGNIRLLRALGWPEGRYWKARDELIEQGQLARGVGRGGSVHLVTADEDDALEEEPQAEPAPPKRAKRPSAPGGYETEADLYPHICEVLRSQWMHDMRIDRLLIETTARQGRKRTGGKWSRPDITVLTYRAFPLTNRQVFDVHTFEVKLAGQWDVTSVFEALAHQRRATYANVFLHFISLDDRSRDILEHCVAEASRLGIGLIVSNNPQSYDSWDIRVEASRREPDPEALEEFVEQQISEENRAELRKWWMRKFVEMS